MSATEESSFSALRWLKTYPCSTMTKEKLNNIILLHCHKDKTGTIDLHLIMKYFATAKEHRKEFYGIYGLILYEHRPNRMFQEVGIRSL